MFCWMRMNLGLILLLFAAFFSMYGCAYQKTKVVEEKSIKSETHKYTKETANIRSTRGYGAFPTGDKSMSAIYVEKIVPSQSLAGQSFDFTIHVTNLTDSTVNDVEVFETLPYNFDVTSSDPVMRGDISTGRVNWFMGDLGPRETKVIRVSGLPSDIGDLVFCCTDIAYKLPSIICKTVSIVQPELRITKHAPPDVIICDTIPINIVVTNTGTGTAQNVKIKESLPSGLRTLNGENYVELEVGSLPSGESREITVEVKADRTGTFDNSATAIAEGGLSADSNTTTTVVTQPILSVTKTGPAKRYIGRNITYNIVVTNIGNGPAVNTVIDDCIPTCTSMVSVSDGGSATGKGVLWDLGTMQPNESREVSVTVRAESLGEAENCALVSAECADAVKDCAVTEISGIPAVLLEVIDIEDPIEVGSRETYVVTVTNQGTAPGTNIRIVCALEDTMQYISSSGATSGSAEGNIVTFAPLATLAPKEKAEWNVNVKAVNPGDVRFKVTLNSDQLDRAVEETESTTFYE